MTTTKEVSKPEIQPEERKITVCLLNTSYPSITFTGDYVTKRELDIVVRAIKKAHKEVIREYRRKRIIAEWKEKEDATRTN